MANRLDLTGSVYGDSTVVEMLYNYIHKNCKQPRTYCRCRSLNGEEVIVRADALKSGATKSIKGAGKTGKPMDITGMKFGLLTALRPTNQRGSNGSIIWECECDCGNITYVPVGQLTRDHTLSCGCRHKSKWEMFIEDLLYLYDINFVTEKRFDDCRNKSKSDMLPFDFYLPDLNICIEYDGEHHFKPVNSWGGSEKFARTQENDKIKNEYCYKNNITLLRLPYTYSKEEIKNEILNILSPATTTV